MPKEKNAFHEALELLKVPAIIDRDGIITWCNRSARQLLFSEGDDLSKCLFGYTEGMRRWDGRTDLQLPVLIAERPWIMTAQICEEQVLLLLQKEEKPEVSQCVLDSVLRGIGPGVELLLHSLRRLIPELEEMEDDRVQNMTSEVIRAGYCLKRSVTAYENLGRLQGDRLRLERHSTDLADFFIDLAEKETDILKECGIRLETSVDIRSSAIGMLDRTEAERIVACLLSNAIQFGEPGKPVQLSVDLQAKILRIRVKNYGAPMDAETLSTAFTQFAQEPENGNQRRGTGIGLALVHAVARQHGGGAVIETGEDGTTVTVSLNVARSDPNTVELSAPGRYIHSSGIDISLMELSPFLPNKLFDSRNVEI